MVKIFRYQEDVVDPGTIFILTIGTELESMQESAFIRFFRDMHGSKIASIRALPISMLILAKGEHHSNTVIPTRLPSTGRVDLECHNNVL